MVITRPYFKVKVFPEQADGEENEYMITAMTPEDARQIAFALDGGMSDSDDKDGAVALFELAMTYTEIVK